ncbi:MAG: CBS domain-containing protein [Euryarchaeota archaeon]|nr:CBS domain-containing protein [Euryarchaeota archaeon]
MLPPLTDIAIRRKKLGLSVEELASIAGVSEELIKNIESGALSPDYELARKIFNALEDAEIIAKDQIVDHIMSTNVVILEECEPVRKAADLMKYYAISQIPVTRNGKITGILTESDIVSGYAKYGKDIQNFEIARLMSNPPPVVRRDTSIYCILPLLRDYPALLVEEQDKIVGIITKADIVYTALNL